MNLIDIRFLKSITERKYQRKNIKILYPAKLALECDRQHLKMFLSVQTSEDLPYKGPQENT